MERRGGERLEIKRGEGLEIRENWGEGHIGLGREGERNKRSEMEE